ncbi:MAG: hypothetical protein QOH69_2957 [Actinomycetota bacterium]|jgi:hypothetical protein|nr:hypothetical protein [Actinomycetota bacterium]
MNTPTPERVTAILQEMDEAYQRLVEELDADEPRQLADELKRARRRVRELEKLQRERAK